MKLINTIQVEITILQKKIALCKKDVVACFKGCLQDFYDFSHEKGRKIDECFFEIYNKYAKGDINE